MTQTLLRTKLYPPHVPNYHVVRQPLRNRLDRVLQHRLTLVSGAAGYGKSSTVIDWLKSENRTFGWLSLDSTDNDFYQFFSYLIAAFQSMDAAIGTHLVEWLEHEPSSSRDRIVTEIINDMLDAANDMIVVLDDYHVIEDPAIHNALQTLIENQPQNLHLILCTRSDPPFPLARWRVRGYLLEVRAADLRLDRVDVKAFVRKRLNSELSEQNLEILIRRTEGWVASIQLVVLAIETQHLIGHPDQIRQFIAEFDGANRYIVDYLVSEVLEHLPVELADFLLRTADLPRFCANLCDAVLERDDSDDVIAQLVKRNLFVIPLDQQGLWYRYHHLFADLITKSAAENQMDGSSVLVCASEWLEEQNLFEDAIELALQVDDYLRVGRLLKVLTQTEIWNDGHWTTLRRWIEHIPDDVLKQDIELFVTYTWCLFATSDLERGFATLQTLDQELAQLSTIPDTVRGRTAGIKGMIARLGGNMAGMRNLGETICQTMPPNDSFWYVSGLINLGAADFLDDAVSESNKWFEQARQVAQINRLPHWEIVALIHLAELAVRSGDLNRAEYIYRQARDISEDEQNIYTSSEGAVYVGLGSIAYERNYLDRATLNYQRGLALGTQTDNALITFSAQMGLAKVQVARGEFNAAVQYVEQLEQMSLIPGFTWTWQHVPVVAAVAHLWMSLEQYGRARRLLQQSVNNGRQADYPVYWSEQMQLAEVGMSMHRGDAEGSLTMLDKLEQNARKANRNHSLLEIHLLQVQALATLHEDDRATEAVSNAIAIAEPSGYVRRFVDGGDIVYKQLKAAASHRVHSNFIRQLLDAFPENTQTIIQQPVSLIEPLTNREQELLELVATGVSNRDIASRLFISYATVRRHLNNIYGKLAVNSRSQAILRAQELHLV